MLARVTGAQEGHPVRRRPRRSVSHAHCSKPLSIKRRFGRGAARCTPCRPRCSPSARGTEPLRVGRMGGEQSNTSLVFGERLILKLFRRLAARGQPRLRDRPVSDRGGALSTRARGRRRIRVPHAGRRVDGRSACCSSWWRARPTAGGTRPMRSAGSSISWKAGRPPRAIRQRRSARCSDRSRLE